MTTVLATMGFLLAVSGHSPVTEVRVQIELKPDTWYDVWIEGWLPRSEYVVVDIDNWVAPGSYRYRPIVTFADGLVQTGPATCHEGPR